MRIIGILQFILVLTIVVSYNQSFSQSAGTGNWFIYIGNQTINSKWNWWNEVQYRNYNFAGDLQQLLIRTGLGYNFSENNNNLILGYGFIDSRNYLPDFKEKSGFHEHRMYQQFITRQNHGGVFFQHRYRMEERFLPEDFQMRFRYFLSLNIPLNNKTMTKNAVYLSMYDEIFLNTKSPVFDRNRLYGALGYMIKKDFRIEAGFMAQTLENLNRNQFQIVVFNNLPLVTN